MDIRQFSVDLPRLHLNIDDIYFDGTKVDEIKNYLHEKLGQDFAEKVMYISTQTFLASFFIEEYKKKIKNNEYLLDHGKCHIKVSTKTCEIKITKYFKLVYITNNEDYILDYPVFNCKINLNLGKICYTWSYEYENDIYCVIDL